jgi:hypothetical protein
MRRVVAQVRFDLPIHPPDLVETGLGGFAGGDFSPVDPVSEFRNGDSVKHRRARMEQSIGFVRKSKRTSTA